MLFFTFLLSFCSSRISGVIHGLCFLLGQTVLTLWLPLVNPYSVSHNKAYHFETANTPAAQNYPNTSGNSKTTTKKIRNQLVNHHLSKLIQQHFKKMQPLLSGKTLHNQSQQSQPRQQKIGTDLKMPTREQVLFNEHLKPTFSTIG